MAKIRGLGGEGELPARSVDSLKLDGLARPDAHHRRIGVVPSEVTLMGMEGVIGLHRATVNCRRTMCQLSPGCDVHAHT